MGNASLIIARWLNVGAPVHAIALSGDGVHLLIGAEHGLFMMDRWGHFRFRYSQPDLSFVAVALAPDLSLGVAAQRTGELLLSETAWLALDKEARDWQEPIRVEPNDIHTLSCAPQAGIIAVGHLGPALTVIDLAGHQRWRRHPNDHNPTDGRTWSVALNPDATTLYVGSCGSARHLLAALDAATGAPQVGVRPTQGVSALATLPSPLAVAAILNDSYEGRVVAYQTDLRHSAWEYVCEPGERATTIVTNLEAGLLAIGTNAGSVSLLSALSGRLLARIDALDSTVHSLAIAGGRYLAAGLEDGQIAYLEYTPARLEEEIEL